MFRKIHAVGAVLFAVLIFTLSACGSKPVDADVLMREAKSNAEAISSCTATFQSRLEFTANGKSYLYQTGNETVYQSKPFATKTTQSSLVGGKTSTGTTYTVTDPDGVWFYSKSDSGWQKTAAGSVTTSPAGQIDILRLMDKIKSQKYVRETTLNNQKVHKLELTLDSDILRSTVENIVTATGIGSGSKTIIQTLLDGADDVYGYCYIDETTGEIVRMELDAGQAVDKIFQNIDGDNVKISVTKFTISGEISRIGKAPAVSLPPDASTARNVQAQG